MDFDTSRFGQISYNPEDVLTFTQPIIGFIQFRRFVLLPGPEGGSLFWLQSVEKGDLAFLLVNPYDIMPDYTVQLSDHDLAELGTVSREVLKVFTLLVVPPNPAEIRTNLRAPILINPVTRLAKQLVMDRSDYPIQYYLIQHAASSGGRPAGEE
ncbi:MAG TPA: flagellar assembly protein FliW [Candidatus Hydrogenedentes bacterium]|nr:flagellar assembly protein FliW [Candidatus Hydrogenedentota bacterium]HOK88885.1 flagellar assembly protein FliW [Candidatus Hydrogenedentota bacterium]